MSTEKVIISFIAVIIGILAASAAFYVYQTTKVIPPAKTKTISIASPTPTPSTSVFLSVDTPKDEDVVDKKTITFTGKTLPNAVIVISTEASDEVITPASNGNFSTTVNITNGTNRIELTAIAPNGEEVKITRTITYSTENF